MRSCLFRPSAFDLQGNRRAAASLLACAAAAAMIAGCGGGGSGGGTGGGSGGAGAGGSTANGGGDLFGGSGGVSGPTVSVPSDADFVPGEKGAYALGEAIDGKGVGDTGIAGGDDGCNILVGVTRDFKGSDEPGGHPDFQSFTGSTQTPGLVAGTLGADEKPVYASQCEADTAGNCPYGQQTTSEDRFDEWYRFAEGVNKPYLIYFQFEPNGDVSTFESTRFFPLDGAGWGMSGEDEDGVQRNFHFTTELHTKFKYQGGETFRFSGDDDLWVFINDRLAIDLGGLHPSVTAQIDLDQSAGELGIEVGKIYSLELFHAERRRSASNFRVDTNLAFVDCGEVLPDPK